MASQGKNKTNFKTYEASTRLLAAVIATNNVKLDYAEIQKLFGESTASGIEWQFRDIKNLGKAQQDAVKKGENPASLPVPGTPAGRKRAAPASTPGSGATARTPSTVGRGRRRNAPAALAPLGSSDDNGDNDSDGVVETPSKSGPTKRARITTATMTPKKSNENDATPIATPTNGATGTPTLAAASPAPRASIFGDGGSTSAAMLSTGAFDNGVQMSTTHGAQHHVQATKPPTIKSEFTTGANPFLGAMNVCDFGEEDQLEEGEI